MVARKTKMYCLFWTRMSSYIKVMTFTQQGTTKNAQPTAEVSFAFINKGDFALRMSGDRDR